MTWDEFRLFVDICLEDVGDDFTIEYIDVKGGDLDADGITVELDQDEKTIGIYT